MSKHTPGPWEVHNGADVFTALGAANASGLCADDNDGWMIADCAAGLTFVGGDQFSLSSDECAANARLIAAAPELLEALTAILDSNTTKVTGRLRTVARVAIAKATGAA